jgi:hypothetical protein
MSTFLIAAVVAVGTTVTLLSLAYLATASAYRGQALQDEEAAKLWALAPRRPQPIAPVVVIRRPRRRTPVAASCIAIEKASDPQPRRAAGGRRH